MNLEIDHVAKRAVRHGKHRMEIETLRPREVRGIPALPQLRGAHHLHVQIVSTRRFEAHVLEGQRTG